MRVIDARFFCVCRSKSARFCAVCFSFKNVEASNFLFRVFVLGIKTLNIFFAGSEFPLTNFTLRRRKKKKKKKKKERYIYIYIHIHTHTRA